MRRYALGKELWEINQTGNQLELAVNGKKTVRTFQTADQAAAQYAKLVAEHEHAGFVHLVSDRRHRELEHVIEAVPEAAAGYAVYADWLQREGDPRGELISMMLAAEAAPNDKLAAAVTRYIAKHVTDLLGPLAKHRKAARRSAEDMVTWRFGFIHRAYLNGVDHAHLDKLLEMLLAHPSGRFLVALGLMTPWEGAQPVIRVLERLAPPTLRELRISQGRARLDLRALWPKMPRLHRLSLNGEAFQIGDVALPELEQLSIRDVEFSAATMSALARAPWPMLKRLEINFVVPEPATIAELWPLLTRADLALTELRVAGTYVGAELVDTLCASPIASGLVLLDLSRNDITDAIAQELVRQRARFPRLETLVAYANPLTPAGMAMLDQMAPTVQASIST